MFGLNLFVYLVILNLNVSLQQQQQQHQPNFEVVKQWKTFSYKFLPNAPIQDKNFYNPMNILGTGLAITQDRIFIATPKLFSGVPSTVSWMPRTDITSSPMLQAYPDWSFITTGRNDFNCSDLVLVSSYRLRIDSCNRLWILDAGISRSLEDYEKTCPPKILIVDLKTDRVVRRIDFPSGILRGETLFTNLVIDETTSKSGTCDDVFVYIADTVEPGIIVYDSVHDTTWRLSHPAMYPDPDFSQAEILGERFVLMDGIVGMTFDDRKGIVYFQPFATDRIFSITRETLRAGPIPINKVLNVKLVGKKSSQSIGLTLSPLDRSLVFSPVAETAVASWNPITNEQHVLAQDINAIQFVGDITVSSADYGYVYALSSRFHRFFLKTLNTNEINNRILRIPLPGIENIKQSLLSSSSSSSLSPSSYAPIKPLDISNVNYYYQISNDFTTPNQLTQLSELKETPTSNVDFSIPVTATTTIATTNTIGKQYPFRHETASIARYNIKHPFNHLNEGREPRNSQVDHSYLASIIPNITVSTSHLTPYVTLTHSNPLFYYRRH